MIRLALFLSLWTGLPFGMTQTNAAELPQKPPLYVFDPAKALSSSALKALETLVIEHERLTGQQILVALWPPEKKMDLTQKTKQAFKKWNVGYSRENGLLFALSIDPPEASIEVGFSLEDGLTST